MKRLLTLLVNLVILTQVSGQSIALENVDSLIEAKKLDEAKSILEAEVDDHDENHQAYFLLAKVLYLQEKFEDASDVAEEAVELQENNARYQLLYAQALYKYGPNAGMLKMPFIARKIKNAFGKVIELDPKNMLAHKGLAWFLSGVPSILGGDMEKAERHAKILLELDEEAARDLYIRIYSRTERFKEAEEHIEMVANKFGSIAKYYDFYNRYGYSLLGEKNYERAIEKFQKQVELAPQEANAYDSLAEAYVLVKDYNKGLLNYRKSLELDPSLLNDDTKERILDLDPQFKPMAQKMFDELENTKN